MLEEEGARQSAAVAMEELEKLGGEYEEDEEEDHWEERWCNADVLCVFPFLTVLGFLCYFGVKGLHHSMLDNDSICQPLRNVRIFSPDPSRPLDPKLPRLVSPLLRARGEEKRKVPGDSGSSLSS